jgi:ribosomal protein S18 acetylase RimI-like enzyme
VERLGARIEIVPAAADDAAALADVAARTFPLACPDSVSADDIAAFLDENLSEERFRSYLADPARVVLIARSEGRIIGYAMLIDGPGADEQVHRAVTARPTAELSKIYVLPDHHGGGAAAGLMTGALRAAAARGARSVWLGVNQRNARAQRFYTKQGFTVCGTRSFRLGGHLESDYVMERPLNDPGT